MLDVKIGLHIVIDLIYELQKRPSLRPLQELSQITYSFPDLLLTLKVINGLPKSNERGSFDSLVPSLLPMLYLVLDDLLGLRLDIYDWYFHFL